MGKAYANRKKESERPANDFYPTPSCMVKALIESSIFNPILLQNKIFDPCCGRKAIGNVLREYGFTDITEMDIMYGGDFFALPVPDEPIYDAIIMNPPFKLFDAFVERAKKFAFKVYCIGKLNYFGVHSRNVSGLWKELKFVLPFDRMIAFDIPETKDGKVACGMMVTGWFYWEKGYSGKPMISVLDMQKYIVKKGEKDEQKNNRT